MNNLLITIEIKNNYGRQVIYPVCERAMLFAKIAGTTTLTEATIKAIRDLGYGIIQQPTKNVFGELIGGLNA